MTTSLESEITVFTDSYLESLFWSEVQDNGEPMDDVLANYNLETL